MFLSVLLISVLKINTVVQETHKEKGASKFKGLFIRTGSKNINK